MVLFCDWHDSTGAICVTIGLELLRPGDVISGFGTEGSGFLSPQSVQPRVDHPLRPSIQVRLILGQKQCRHIHSCCDFGVAVARKWHLKALLPVSWLLDYSCPLRRCSLSLSGNVLFRAKHVFTIYFCISTLPEKRGLSD